MSDTSWNLILQYGSATARGAFTPNPAVGSQILYIWVDDDDFPTTAPMYIWNGSSFQLAGTGTASSIGADLALHSLCGGI